MKISSFKKAMNFGQLNTETESIDSESSMGSISQRNKLNLRNLHPKSYFRLNPNDPLLSNRCEEIIKKYFDNNNRYQFDKLKSVLDEKSIFEASKLLEKLKLTESKSENENKLENLIFFDPLHISLNDDDYRLGKEWAQESSSEASKSTNQKSISFETYLMDDVPVSKLLPKPYIDFDLPAYEGRQHLYQLIKECSKNDLEMSSLPKNIEQQLTVKPFRQSKRQRKKMMAIERRKTLPNWFDMKNIDGLTKEQQKDLLALKMRRVWNPKQFFKKASQISASTGDGLNDKSRFFQIGTIQSTEADFYSSRLYQKERKRTIIDELMNDAQLQAYNKRKRLYALTKQSRLKILMQRAKMRKMKQKIRAKKAEKANRYGNQRDPHRTPNVDKTFEL